jgi:Mn2+/Fe2+ NRAMP family transporter
MGIVIVSLSTAYAFAEFFGVEGSIDAPADRGKLFYGIFLFQLLLAFAIVMIPSVSLFKIVFYTQSLNGAIMPFVFYFLLKITNDKDLMGVNINSKWYNYFATVSSVVIVFASLFTIISSLLQI